jgi:hypothetical protein
MRNILLTLALLTATSAFAQDKVQCRPLATNDFVRPDESLVNSGSETLVCHVVKPAAVVETKAQPAPATLSPAVASAPIAAAAPAEAPSTTSAPAAPAPSSTEQTQATIYFYRPRRFVGSALKPSVFVDDARVGRMHNGDSIKISVAPGTHEVYSNDKSTGLSLEAKAGQTYYVRIDIQVGAFKGHGGVTLMDPQQGKYEIKAAAHQSDDN